MAQNRMLVAVWLLVLSTACAQSCGQDAFAAPPIDPQAEFLLTYARVHSALARRACELSQKQETDLRAMDGKWIQAQVKKATNAPVNKNVGGIARFLGNLAQPVQPNVRQPFQVQKNVRKAIDERLIEVLDEEQVQSFQEQKEIRDAFRRDALSLVMIAALDQHLFLSADQRKALHMPIAEWLKTKDLYWQFYFQNRTYVPDIPLRILSSHLNENQRESLRGMHRTNFNMDQMQVQMMNQQQNVVIKDP